MPAETPSIRRRSRSPFRGEPAGRIDISLGEYQGGGLVAVRDDGGLAGEEPDRTLGPYFSAKEMGTGTGPYLAATIIEGNMERSARTRDLPGGAQVAFAAPLGKRSRHRTEGA